MFVKNKARVATAAIAGLGLAFSLSACGGSSDPEGAVQKLLDNGDKIGEALLTGDEAKATAEAAKYMCAENATAIGSIAAMAAESGEELSEEDFKVGDVEYEITGSEIDGDTAVVTVEITAGDNMYQEGSSDIDVVKEDDGWVVCQEMG